jgi:riboflavin synthase
MFTGIIKTIGKVKSIEEIQNDIHLTISYQSIFDIELGDSICVNGACLTVFKFNGDTLEFHLSKETLSKIVPFKINQFVNLEESLRVGDKVGGHYVFGHVDSKAVLIDIKKESDCKIWYLEIPQSFQKFIASKGSISLNGVSLTINTVKRNIFTVNLIPHTIEHTVFKYNNINDHLNFEIDMLARYALNG